MRLCSSQVFQAAQKLWHMKTILRAMGRTQAMTKVLYGYTVSQARLLSLHMLKDYLLKNWPDHEANDQTKRCVANAHHRAPEV